MYVNIPVPWILWGWFLLQKRRVESPWILGIFPGEELSYEELLMALDEFLGNLMCFKVEYGEEL